MTEIITREMVDTVVDMLEDSLKSGELTYIPSEKMKTFGGFDIVKYHGLYSLYDGHISICEDLALIESAQMIAKMYSGKHFGEVISLVALDRKYAKARNDILHFEHMLSVIKEFTKRQVYVDRLAIAKDDMQYAKHLLMLKRKAVKL